MYITRGCLCALVFAKKFFIVHTYLSLQNVLIRSTHWWARKVIHCQEERRRVKKKKKSDSFSIRQNNDLNSQALTDKRRIHNSGGAKAFFWLPIMFCALEMPGSDFPARRSVAISLHSPAHRSIIIKYVFDFHTMHSLLDANGVMRDVWRERERTH